MPTTAKDDVVDLVKRLVSESSRYRESFTAQADINKRMFMGDYSNPNQRAKFGHSAFVLNKTQNSVIAHTSVQVEQKPRIKLTPRETGDQKVFFMTRKGLNSIRNVVDTEVVESMERPNLIGDEAGGPAEMEDESFDFGLLDVNPDRMAFEVTESFVTRVMPFSGPWKGDKGEAMAPILDPDDVVTLDDRTMTEIVQRNVDYLWEKGDNDAWLMRTILYNNIIGWQPSLYQWDKELMRDGVSTLNVKNVYVPQECEGVKDAEYTIVGEFMSKKAAKEKYPSIAKAITTYTVNHTTGVLTDMMDQQNVSDIYRDTEYERPMIWVWTAWLRNHRYAMTPDEALDTGRVVVVDDQFMLTDDEYEPTSEATGPQMKNWPKRKGIRQVQIVADHKVSDMECPYCDIPVLWFKNIPEPYRPYGQGEPERMEWLQKLINKLASIIFDHIKYFRSPTEIYPVSVWNSLENRSKIHAHPGRQMKLPDDLFDKYKDMLARGNGFAVSPAKIPSGYVDFFMMLLKIHDELSGFAGVLQGQAPGANSSGRAIQDLQSAARGVIAFKAFGTEDALKQMIRLRVDSTTRKNWMPPFMWQKINSQFPKEVLAVVRQKCRNMEFDITIEIAAGGGESRRIKKQQTLEDFGSGLVDDRTALEVLEYDADEVINRKTEMLARQNPAEGVPQQV